MEPELSLPTTRSILQTENRLDEEDRDTGDGLGDPTYVNRYLTNKNLTRRAGRPTSSIDVQRHEETRPPLITVLSKILAKKPLMPYESVPCANIDIEKNWKCPEKATSRCSGCALVCYCSQVGLYLIASFSRLLC